MKLEALSLKYLKNAWTCSWFSWFVRIGSKTADRTVCHRICKHIARRPLWYADAIWGASVGWSLICLHPAVESWHWKCKTEKEQCCGENQNTKERDSERQTIEVWDLLRWYTQRASMVLAGQQDLRMSFQSNSDGKPWRWQLSMQMEFWRLRRCDVSEFSWVSNNKLMCPLLL